MPGWWFGIWNIFYFPIIIGNVIIPIDELIFFRGVAQPLASCISDLRLCWRLLGREIDPFWVDDCCRGLPGVRKEDMLPFMVDIGLAPSNTEEPQPLGDQTRSGAFRGRKRINRLVWRCLLISQYHRMIYNKFEIVYYCACELEFHGWCSVIKILVVSCHINIQLSAGNHLLAKFPREKQKLSCRQSDNAMWNSDIWQDLTTDHPERGWAEQNGARYTMI